MNIAELKGEAQLRVVLALTVSRKPMNTVELMGVTGLKVRAIREATKALRDVGLISARDCVSPTYGECRIEFRLSEPLTMYASKKEGASLR